MPTTAAIALSTQTLPVLDTPTPKKTFGVTDVQSIQAFPLLAKSCHCELDFLFSSTIPYPSAPSVQPQLPSTTNSDYDANSSVPQSGEDEYTLSAYGDISLGEVIVPPLPSPPPGSGVLQPKIPQPHLRLKVRRPPMPRRRLSYIYVPDPLPYTGGLDSDERWPGSPRPIVNNSSWLQHQPLASPLADPTSPRAQGNKPVKNDVPSLERLADELLSRSPSIRLSPPGSPASQALSLPQETRGQQNGVQQARRLPKANDAAVKPAQFPVRQQDKPWRTRLPPRPPIPKWDM